jgi:electron transport complex protein RnfE
LLFGDWATILRIEVYQLDSQFLLAILPPGAFIAMGFLIALKNVIDAKHAQKQPKKAEDKTIERVRVNFDAQ